MGGLLIFCGSSIVFTAAAPFPCVFFTQHSPREIDIRRSFHDQQTKFSMVIQTGNGLLANISFSNTIGNSWWAHEWWFWVKSPALTLLTYALNIYLILYYHEKWNVTPRLVTLRPLLIMVWMNYQMSSQVRRVEATYLFPNWNGCTVEFVVNKLIPDFILL